MTRERDRQDNATSRVSPSATTDETRFQNAEFRMNNENRVETRESRERERK
jgi:hypothetical protein